MRIQETKLYPFNELSNKAKERAIDTYRNTNDEILWQSELLDSLKAVFEKSGLTLKDYGLGLCSYSYVKFDIEDSVGDLRGIRALTWLENNLFDNLRISRREYLKNRKDYLSYGSLYRIGKIAPCPLTGYCADECYLEALKNDIQSGSSIKEAYTGLADEYIRLLQSEYDHQNSSEYIADHFSANDYEFDEYGNIE